MIDPPAQIELEDSERDATAGAYTSIPNNDSTSLSFDVSPETVVLTVSVLFVPELLKFRN